MTKIHIDNKKFSVVESNPQGIYVDSPELPGLKCAYHRLNTAQQDWINLGASVKTNGHIYSYYQYKEPT